jgi:hypothetical protein
MLNSARSLIAAGLAVLASPALAMPTFFNTTSPSNWQVATNLPPGTDGDVAQFPVGGPWEAAAACTGRAGWIANIPSCTNGAGGNIGGSNWTQFIFRQSFDLTASEAANLQLSFNWAADDSGQVFAVRGMWKPVWSLNSLAEGSLRMTSWPSDESYVLSPTVTVSGFQAGTNTMYFWVQGNGRTDGMRLENAQFSAVPVPGTLALAGQGLLAAGLVRRRAAGARG